MTLLSAIAHEPDCGILSKHHAYFQSHIQPLFSGPEGRRLDLQIVCPQALFSFPAYLRNGLASWGTLSEAPAVTGTATGARLLLLFASQGQGQLDAFTALTAKSEVEVLGIPMPLLTPNDSDIDQLSSVASIVDQIAGEFRAHGIPYLPEVLPIVSCSHQTLQETKAVLANSRIPWTGNTYWELARMLAEWAVLRTLPPIKWILVDADNTLWDGVAGENREIPPITDSHAAVQQALADLKSQGIVLVLCSKNNLSDTKRTFETVPNMRLRWQDFAAHYVNWDSKVASIESAANQLGLSLDSAMFLDDDPRECHEVHLAFPELFVLNADDGWLQECADFLRTRVLPAGKLTEEDLARSELYASHRQRQEFREQHVSRKEFLDSLHLTVRIDTPSTEDLVRVAQLTARANQFNLMGTRYSVDDLVALARLPSNILLVARAQDRFGSYGLIGFIVGRITEGVCDVDVFVLSCRAIGLDMELQLLAGLNEQCRNRRMSRVNGFLKRTERNKPSWDVYERAGFQSTGNDTWTLGLT